MNKKLKMPIFRGRRHVSSIIRPSLFLSPQPFHAFFPRFPSIIKMLPERQFSSWSYICLAFFFIYFSFAHLKYIFLHWFRFIWYARTFAKFLLCRRVIIHKTSPRDLRRGVLTDSYNGCSY